MRIFNAGERLNPEIDQSMWIRYHTVKTKSVRLSKDEVLKYGVLNERITGGWYIVPVDEIEKGTQLYADVIACALTEKPTPPELSASGMHFSSSAGIQVQSVNRFAVHKKDDV